MERWKHEEWMLQTRTSETELTDGVTLVRVTSETGQGMSTGSATVLSLARLGEADSDHGREDYKRANKGHTYK